MRSSNDSPRVRPQRPGRSGSGILESQRVERRIDADPVRYRSAMRLGALPRVSRRPGSVFALGDRTLPSRPPGPSRGPDLSAPKRAVSQRIDVASESTSPAPRPFASTSRGPPPANWRSLPVAIAAIEGFVDAVTSGALGAGELNAREDLLRPAHVSGTDHRHADDQRDGVECDSRPHFDSVSGRHHRGLMEYARPQAEERAMSACVIRRLRRAGPGSPDRRTLQQGLPGSPPAPEVRSRRWNHTWGQEWNLT